MKDVPGTEAVLWPGLPSALLTGALKHDGGERARMPGAVAPLGVPGREPCSRLPEELACVPRWDLLEH